MSIDVIKEQIFKFLSSETPDVMAIKGDWGVGKTYSWKKFLSEANASKKVKLDRYSYVSLFGINSLDAFKYTIFENVVKKEMIGTEASLDTFKNNITGIIEALGRQSLNIFKGSLVVKPFSPAIETIAFLSLKNTLICIDDLERKGSDLDIKDVLGLVSLLKEQKKCKIVLLLNDGEEGIKDYFKYREKVIDIELKFAPSPEECSSIAYSEDKENFPRLKELVNSLEIRNIRILKKIERLVDLVLPLAQDYEPKITDQVLRSLALFSWCYYSPSSNEDIPSFEFVTSKGRSMYRIGDDEKEKKWKAILQDYNFQLTDELDLVLAEAVKTGFVVEDDFTLKAIAKSEEILAAKSRGSFYEAWRLYRDTFDNNADEVVSKLFESFKKHCKYITPSNLNGTVSLFRELGKEREASRIIDIYMEQRTDETDLFNLQDNDFFDSIKDAEIIEKFDIKYNATVTTESAKEVLANIAGKNTWGPSDEVVLASTTIDEYYDLFKSEKGKNLRSYISTCLKFGRYGDASEQQKEIANRAIEALKRIALESKINKSRVKRFGVDI